MLRAMPDRRFQVAGHTDDVKMQSARYPSNWELSTTRAVEVVKRLIEGGMYPKNLAASGYGEFAPAESNATPEGRAKNRRIEIALQPNLDEFVKVPGVNDAAPAPPAAKPPPAAAPEPAPPAAPAPDLHAGSCTQSRSVSKSSSKRNASTSSTEPARVCAAPRRSAAALATAATTGCGEATRRTSSGTSSRASRMAATIAASGRASAGPRARRTPVPT